MGTARINDKRIDLAAAKLYLKNLLESRRNKLYDVHIRLLVQPVNTGLNKSGGGGGQRRLKNKPVAMVVAAVHSFGASKCNGRRRGIGKDKYCFENRKKKFETEKNRSRRHSQTISSVTAARTTRCQGERGEDLPPHTPPSIRACVFNIALVRCRAHVTFFTRATHTRQRAIVAFRVRRRRSFVKKKLFGTRPDGHTDVCVYTSSNSAWQITKTIFNDISSPLPCKMPVRNTYEFIPFRGKVSYFNSSSLCFPLNVFKCVKTD